MSLGFDFLMMCLDSYVKVMLNYYNLLKNQSFIFNVIITCFSMFLCYHFIFFTLTSVYFFVQYCRSSYGV